MLAIIPARGGSKGLPGKNIKLLNGKPLIAYTIEAAMAAKKISRIIVSTDSRQIAKVAMDYGAESPFLRPEHLATDTALSIDIYDYTLSEIEKQEAVKIEKFMVLQPTSPLRTAEDIDNAIELFNTKSADSVISYCQEYHPIKWHRYVTNEGKLKNIFEETLNNRQEERPSYFPNGAIYIIRRDLIKKRSYISDNSYAYIMDKKKSIDIDTIEDFEYAEFLLKNKNLE